MSASIILPFVENYPVLYPINQTLLNLSLYRGCRFYPYILPRVLYIMNETKVFIR